MKGPLVYVAGPYTHPDPVENTHKAIKFADFLGQCGCVPVVPHLTLFWHSVTPKPYDHWLAYDLRILERCDALFRMRGESSGADEEVEHAKACGIPVFTNHVLLGEWARRWSRWEPVA